MTPDDLRALATVMRDLGVFKVTMPDGVTIELSQHAIQAGQAERQSREDSGIASAEGEPGTTTAKAEDEDALDFAATEGFPE